MNRRGRRPLLCTRETRPQGIHQVRGRLRSGMLRPGDLLAGGLALDEVAERILSASTTSPVSASTFCIFMRCPVALLIWLKRTLSDSDVAG